MFRFLLWGSADGGLGGRGFADRETEYEAGRNVPGQNSGVVIHHLLNELSCVRLSYACGRPGCVQ